jgi:hypothetical protein
MKASTVIDANSAAMLPAVKLLSTGLPGQEIQERISYSQAGKRHGLVFRYAVADIRNRCY